MKVVQRLVWSEGMFLSPQHLQAFERFQESLFSARLTAISPFDWGVVAVEIDAAALGAGQLRVQRFAGILPGGTPLAFEENDTEAPQQRNVAPLFPATARSLDVHLGVPRERDGVSPFAEEGNGAARTRYLVSSRPVQDTTAPGGATVPVAFARLNATLLVGDEPREDYETVKIAEIVRGPAGQLAVSDGYVPPCLRIAAAPGVVARMRELLARAIGKQRELADGRQQREAVSATAVSDLARQMQLLVLNAGIPVLAHHAEVADGSAREVYLALSQLAGQLSTFGGDADPATLPKFAYTDLRSTFDPLFARLGKILGEVGGVQYVAVPLEQRPGGLHLARIQDDRILRSQLFLAVKSELSEQQVAEQVPRLCKIASTSEIQGLMQAAAPGLSLKVVHRPPPQIPLRAGTQYFALASDDRYWQSILVNRNIALFLPPPFDPVRTKVELFAIAQQPAAATRF
ncbi:MAG: type VI secretion system baseplate subunit TssK [Myxococcales bacterium]